jgi:phosphatidylglycerophosphatase C
MSVHAFFDYDGTLAEGDSILYWIRYYHARRPARRLFKVANVAGLLLFSARVISSHTLKRVFLWPMAFEKPAALDALTAAFVRDDLSQRFHAPVLDRLWAHDRLGHRTIVISASGMFYLKHLAAYFPPSCVLLGTEIEWDGGANRLARWLRFPAYQGGNLRGDNKIRRLRALGFAGAGKSGFAYSDHHHDIPLLEFAEFPECIRPTPKLARAARARQWPVRNWPRARPLWKLKLEAFCLLLTARAPRFLQAKPVPPQPGSGPGIPDEEQGIRNRLWKVAP